jgi:hypothetical protein
MEFVSPDHQPTRPGTTMGTDQAQLAAGIVLDRFFTDVRELGDRSEEVAAAGISAGNTIFLQII